MRMRNLWYKSAVIYEVDVRTFYDSDGNGWGDFQGLIHRLDHISSLGTTAVWLKPFNASPHRDGGYDISDYYAVEPRIGTMGDFVDFLEEASSRGIAVISELVANHTSIDHPWFGEAAASRNSRFRDFYVWRDEPPPPEDSPPSITFGGDDPSPWTLHEETGQYYLHRFYEHEPDLNNANPIVQDEIHKLVGFYLRAGVAGLRIDAAPYVAQKAAGDPDMGDAHAYLKALRRFVVSRRPDGVLMAEADLDAEVLDDYFGDGDEMNLLLNFLLSQYIFAGLAAGSAEPLHHLLDILPHPPPEGQFANFIRNHDELDLERLPEDLCDAVFERFAPDPGMRIFGRGIRRRLAPMLDGDQERIRLAQSLLFSMPGTPVIYYGDEIGMGDDLTLEDRNPVRTPMQWSPEENGGFSSADRDRLFLPPIDSGPFGYRSINVMDQQADPDSLLNWTRRLITTRKEARPVGTGDWRLVDTGHPDVLALRYDLEEEVAVVLHNLAADSREVEVKLEGDVAYLYEVLADRRYGHPEADRLAFDIGRHGYRWLRGRTRAGAERRRDGEHVPETDEG